MYNRIKKLFDKIIKADYAFSILNKIILILTGIISASLINRYLGPESKGEYAYIINIVNLVVIVANLGLYQSYAYCKRIGMQNQFRTYANTFAFQFLAYFLIATVLIICFQGSILSVAMLLIPIRVLTQQMSMVTLIEFLRYRQVAQLCVNLLNVALSLLLFMLFPKNILFVLGLTTLIDIVLILTYFFREKYVPNPFHIDIRFIGFLLKFGLFAMFGALLINLNYKIDVFILKKYVSFTEIGFYSIGTQLAEFAWIIPDAFKEILFSRTAKSDAIDDIVMSIKVNVLIVSIILISVLLFGKTAIRILFGNEFIPSYGVTCIIFLGIPSMILFKLINTLFLANGKQKLYMVILLISVIINVALNFILDPFWGKEGAAVASVVSYSVCGLIMYVIFIRKYRINWYAPLVLTKQDVQKIKKQVVNIFC